MCFVTNEWWNNKKKKKTKNQVSCDNELCYALWADAVTDAKRMQFQLVTLLLVALFFLFLFF